MALPNEVKQLFQGQVITENVRFRNYPANAVGAQVTSGKSYAYGNWKEIIAANGVTTEFWLTDVCVDTASAADIYLIGVGSGAGGAEVLLWEGRIDVTAITMNVPPLRVARPIRIAANTRVAMESAAATANNRTFNGSVTVGTAFRNGS